MKRVVSIVLVLALCVGVCPVQAAEISKSTNEEIAIAQEIEQEIQRTFEDIHTQLESQGALKYEQQVQEIVAQQIEIDVYHSHGYPAPVETRSTNKILHWDNQPGGGVLGYTQVGLTQVTMTYLSDTATEKLVAKTGKRIAIAKSIDEFTQASFTFISAAEALYRKTFVAAELELAIRILSNAYITVNTLPENVANGNACAYMMVIYIPTDSVTVGTILEWKSYPDVSVSDEGIYNVDFKPF